MVKGSPRYHCILEEGVRLGLRSECVLCSYMPNLPTGQILCIVSGSFHHGALFRCAADGIMFHVTLKNMSVA